MINDGQNLPCTVMVTASNTCLLLYLAVLLISERLLNKPYKSNNALIVLASQSHTFYTPPPERKVRNHKDTS